MATRNVTNKNGKTTEQVISKDELRNMTELFDKMNLEKAGAGRGEQGGPTARELKANSRAQYNAEKAAGGAQTDLSYEDWKKLD